MAVVSLNSNEWHNADNLLVKFHRDEATVTRGGVYGTVAEGRYVAEISLDLVELAAACPAAGGDECIICDNVVIPSGALIENVQVVVTETSVGATANLDLGLVDQDRTTEIDFNGLLIASDAWVELPVGTTVDHRQGDADHGALVGTVLTNSGLVTASPDTADPTDGVLKIRIFYSIPVAAEL